MRPEKTPSVVESSKSGSKSKTESVVASEKTSEKAVDELQETKQISEEVSGKISDQGSVHYERLPRVRGPLRPVNPCTSKVEVVVGSVVRPHTTLPFTSDLREKKTRANVDDEFAKCLAHKEAIMARGAKYKYGEEEDDDDGDDEDDL